MKKEVKMVADMVQSQTTTHANSTSFLSLTREGVGVEEWSSIGVMNHLRIPEIIHRITELATRGGDSEFKLHLNKLAKSTTGEFFQRQQDSKLVVCEKQTGPIFALAGHGYLNCHDLFFARPVDKRADVLGFYVHECRTFEDAYNFVSYCISLNDKQLFLVDPDSGQYGAVYERFGPVFFRS